MSRCIAIQMDPIAKVDINADTTFALALQAQRRGYMLYHYLPSALTLRGARLTARARPLVVSPDDTPPYTVGGVETLDLHTVDVVLMRQDPPFDMAYITATHLLEHIQPGTLVVNDPAGVRNAPEKLLVTHLPDLTPDTMITRDADAIRSFRAERGEIILKPLYGCGGAGVFHIRRRDPNLSALLEMLLEADTAPLIAQQYLPEVRKGDRRVILIDGAPVGVINRVPKSGESRSNMHVGGKAKAATLTARDREICDRLGPLLRERGLFLVGIDIIGDRLTEINVTSPTGLQEIDRFDDVSLEALFWDAIERRLDG